MQESLNELAKAIAEYKESDIEDGNHLNTLLQKIVGNLAYLETERAYYHEEWQREINYQILQGESVSRSKNLAEIKVPQLYKLRRIMDGAYECVGAIRSHISWLKSEKQNSNT